MADQIPRIKSTRQVLQLNPPRLCLQTLMVSLCLLTASICSVQTATCSSSVPSSAVTITEQYKISGSATISYGVAVGPVSKSLYYLYWISFNAAVRKVDASGSQTWVTSFTLNPISKSLSIDAAEQSVYLASCESPLVVIKLDASSGSIASQHQL